MNPEEIPFLEEEQEPAMSMPTFDELVQKTPNQAEPPVPKRLDMFEYKYFLHKKHLILPFTVLNHQGMARYFATWRQESLLPLQHLMLCSPHLPNLTMVH
jgi:hypothetical protein